ncbi:unnamed protein product [Prorocentrum cordatum]|uniref:Protein RFT1 homolog n=1 Tax=Prorocentrum cordatum TaxID=2364126 RepID=A0ABN9XDY3_9DINO|nr:unnamed protein product [Polarella glacialis]
MAVVAQHGLPRDSAAPTEQRQSRRRAMADVEHFLSPLFRPPLGLAVTGAALKYVATTIILADPLLRTRGDFIREREDSGMGARLQRLALLVGRGVFIGLAAACFEQDRVILSEGFRHLSGLQCCHLVAMVLAFSPNTVAAVAAVGIIEVKAAWLNGFPINSCFYGSLADAAAVAYVAFMGLVYLLPLLVISTIYGIPGLCAIAWSFSCEFVFGFVVRPWQLLTQGRADFSSFWIVLPAVAVFMLAVLQILLIAYCVCVILEKRYPQIAQQEKNKNGGGGRSRLVREMPAHVIGLMRELGGWKVGAEHSKDAIGDSSCSAELELLPKASDGKDVEISGAQPPRGSRLCGMAAHEEDQCLLNDTTLGAIWMMKVTGCIAMPLLQVCVVITAKVLLGQAGPWGATLEVFSERSWTKYFQQIWSSGSSGVLPILWYYT